MGNTKKGFPFGFYVCSLSFTFERLAYYAAKWGLTIFIAAKAVNGGLGLDKTVGATMSANLVALTYITPIIGGYIADDGCRISLCMEGKRTRHALGMCNSCFHRYWLL